MPLLGVLDGIGDEVGDDLLNAPDVEGGGQMAVRIVFDELHGTLGILYTQFERLADVVEGWGEVYIVWHDVLRTVNKGRRLEDVVDEAQQDVAVVADDADELAALLGRVDGAQQVRETNDGVERRAQLVGH